METIIKDLKMQVSTQTVNLNKIAKEILLAESYLTLTRSKRTNYSIAKRINEVREINGDFSTIEPRTVKKYKESNLKIKEI